MAEKYLTKKREFLVSVDEVDYREILKPGSILQYFQDIATAHAKDIGVGYEEMIKQNLCWVITKLSYRIIKNPLIDDKIFVITFPKKPRSIEAARDFYIENEKGELLVRGNTRWCVLDFVNRSIKRCDGLFLFADEEYNPDNAVADGGLKIPALIELNAEIEKVYDYTVRVCDLDRNLHMNNARYGDCVLNAYSPEELAGTIIKSFDINFINEMKIGEAFTLYRAVKDSADYYEAVKNDGKIVFRAKVCKAPR